ncbi:MAG: cupin domain-containing protein [Haloferacaceae archaeon]
MGDDATGNGPTDADGAPGYDRTRVTDVEPTPDKPGARHELSAALGMTDYNYNVAVVDPGDRLSRTGYHAHPDQEEFYHVLDGRCRVETPDGAFVLGPDGCCRFDPGVAHMLHNPYDAPCRLVAVGAPPDAHHPVRQVSPFEEFLAERYPDGVPLE